ncbi:MAG: hypothetical protein IPM52_14405 [Bacteroidetes bacterium]|nr:hypothetical protein [Bacteroidota bacterium]
MKLSLLIIALLFSGHLSLSQPAVLFNGSGQPLEHRLAAMTLAGIVNRHEPRLYLLNVYEAWSYNQTDEQWRDIYAAAGVQFVTEHSFSGLVDRFRDDIKGVVTYDKSLTYCNFSGQNFRWQGEVAAMAGGLADCIPLPHDSPDFFGLPLPDSITIRDHFGRNDSIRISARLELSAHPWNNALPDQETRYFAILDWALEYILPFTNPACFYLREITDWAVSQRMFQLNLAGSESLNFYSLSDAKAERIEQVMQYLRTRRPGQLFHVYGWMRPEPLVQWISAWGGSFHETLLSNISWHHVFPADSNFEYTRPSAVTPGTTLLEDKYYVLFLGSEGDAGNWNLGFQAGAWHSVLRGQVPLGWGFNLHMFDLMPFVAQYYYSTATGSDGFVSVTNPLGYVYADMFPPDIRPHALQQATALMQKFDVPAIYAYKHYNGAGESTYRGVLISNNYHYGRLAQFSQQSGALLTFLFDPGLLTQQAYEQFGGLLYNHVNDETFYAPVVNLQQAAARIAGKLNGKPRPNFLLAGYQRLRQDNFTIGSSNQADITLPRLRTLMQQIQLDPVVGPHVVFVTPDQFTDLLRQHLGIIGNTKELASSVRLRASTGAAGQLHIGMEGYPHALTGQLSCYDLQGRLIWQEALVLEPGHIQATRSTLTGNGVYLLRFAAKEGISLTAKVLKVSD